MVTAEQFNDIANTLTTTNNDSVLLVDEWSFQGRNLKYPTKKVYISIINAPTTPLAHKWI
jgi:hypothetical protein